MSALSPPGALIWIVDDSRTQRTITQIALGAAHRYEHFTDGPSAIERLTSGGALPDLVLLDWMMPGLNGDEVCRFLRSYPATRDVPVIILTATATASEDAVTALECGANDYAVKPFVPQVLRARVSVVLRAALLKREAEQERRRLTTLNRLGRALFTGTNDVDAILDVLADALTAELVDACAVTLLSGPVGSRLVTRYRAGHASLLDAVTTSTTPVHRAVLPLAVRGLGEGAVTVTRDARALPFDPGDLAAIETCLELAGLAIEAAIRLDAERATARFHEEMIGMVSHDLRTPLGAIASCVELLDDGGSDDATRAGIVGRIGSTTRRMTGIVEQLLDVTRTRLGSGIPIARRPARLGAIVTDVLSELRLTFRATTFRQDGEDVVGAWDADRLGQAISNLSSNAAQYGPPSGTVTVETSRTDGVAQIVVRNQNRGAPIPEAQLKTLFDPFKRGDGAGHAKGLGLGLYIVHEIIVGHGGTIVVTSDLAGTAFRISLPIAAS